jgi:hypothetical protein
LWRDMPAGSVETVVDVLARLHAHRGEIAAAAPSDEGDAACAPS